MNEEGKFRYSDVASSNEDIQDVRSFVQMLKVNSDKVKLEAASALLHVLSINHVNTGKGNKFISLDVSSHSPLSIAFLQHQLVVECGAIPVLLDALESSKQSVRDECVKCLRTIISFSSELRDLVIELGGLSKL